MQKTLEIPVSKVMSTDLLIVHPEDKLDKVRDIFQANNIHHIPVVDKDGKLVGMLSKSDFAKVNHMLTLFNEDKYREYNDKLYRCLDVREIMTEQVATLDPDEPLTVAADIFKENLFHALPVVDGKVLLGVVTTHDLINYCCTDPTYLEG